MQPKQRQLNIELLRIFSMLLITLWHAKVHFLNHMTEVPEGLNTLMQYIVMFIPFHVNLFILITGYFGVRDNRRGLVRTALLVWFYSLVLNAVCAMFGESVDIWQMLLPFSRSEWWFMRMYLLLLIAAPVIESYLSRASRAEALVLTGAALVVDVWMSWFNHTENLYAHGYDFINFIAVYIVGANIRKVLRGGGLRLSIYALAVAIPIFLVLQYKAMGWGLSVDLTDYNSPYALLMAVTVFLLFLRLRVPSVCTKVIIFFSTSAVAAYLITDFPGVKALLLPRFAAAIPSTITPTGGFCIIVLMVLAAFVLSCVADKLRIILTTPVERLLFKKLKLQ